MNTEPGPGILISFFRYNTHSNILYTNRIRFVNDLHAAAPLVTQITPEMDAVGSVVAYAYLSFDQARHSGFGNTVNPNMFAHHEQIINNLVVPVNQVFSEVDVVLVDIIRTIRVWFVNGLQNAIPLAAIALEDDHPNKIDWPTRSYDSEGGGGGNEKDDMLLSIYKGTYVSREQEIIQQSNRDHGVDTSGLIQQTKSNPVVQAFKDTFSGAKEVGKSIWTSTKNFFTKKTDQVETKTKSVVNTVKSESNKVVGTATNLEKETVNTVKGEVAVVTAVAKSAQKGVVTEIVNDVAHDKAVFGEMAEVGAEFGQAAQRFSGGGGHALGEAAEVAEVVEIL